MGNKVGGYYSPPGRAEGQSMSGRTIARINNIQEAKTPGIWKAPQWRVKKGAESGRPSGF